MTKAEALYSFFSSFGISAYASASVPDDVELPYLTYEQTLGNWLDENNLPVHLWYYTTSEAVPNTNGSVASSFKIRTQYCGVSLKKYSANGWFVFGDVAI